MSPTTSHGPFGFFSFERKRQNFFGLRVLRCLDGVAVSSLESDPATSQPATPDTHPEKAPRCTARLPIGGLGA